MRKLINEKQKHLLWCDEIDDEFLITKYLEIFEFNDKILKCYCWNTRVYNSLVKTGKIFDLDYSDDPLFIFKTDAANLDLLLGMGTHSRRPNINGRWLQNLKTRLAHDIRVPRNLSNLKKTMSLYQVKINGKEFIVNAPTRSKASYQAWKEHPDFTGKAVNNPGVSVKTIKKTSDINQSSVLSSEVHHG